MLFPFSAIDCACVLIVVWILSMYKELVATFDNGVWLLKSEPLTWTLLDGETLLDAAGAVVEGDVVEFLLINMTWDNPPPEMGNQPPVESSRVITCAFTLAMMQEFDPFTQTDDPGDPRVSDAIDVVMVVVGESRLRRWLLIWCPRLTGLPFMATASVGGDGDSEEDGGNNGASVVDTIILTLEENWRENESQIYYS